MPLQRRLPKFGFTSHAALGRDEIRLEELNQFEGEIVDLLSLRAAGLINNATVEVKIIAKGTISRALVVKGVKVTKGAQIAIESAGGRVEA
jgi:large subunit ribosomal protein L15